ncbi:MAG TPA: PhzF family phenazine biosynthesis isomerase [Micromonosporaceae bacterium]
MEILRYTAFSTDPRGGNPAGVVLDATGLDDAAMLAIAVEVGYSETAFLSPADGATMPVRYFSPLAEVPFCGHATIALAVAYADRHGTGTMRLDTRAGLVEVATATAPDGALTATLVSVAPRLRELPDDELLPLLEILGWSAADLDPALPPRVAYAGAWHPILAAASRERLARLSYDLPTLNEYMNARDWTTVDLVWRAGPSEFHARNPFPPGGVVEDPATGAAAAALGGYLRALGLVIPPVTVTVYQGEDMGRPGVITVTIPAEPDRGIAVSGTAVRLTD